MDLFAQDTSQQSPLSVRMRPRTMAEYVGQPHILGEGKLLTRALEADRISSLILYGPPGVGKTTLAHCISHHTEAVFERVNAVSSNVEELRKLIKAAQHRRSTGGTRTIVFIDEIHRFNKAQQDVLMPDVEDGTIILIGATTMNPYFALVAPLLSRSLVFELKPLTTEDIDCLLRRALTDKNRGFGSLPIAATDDAINFLAETCDGDARRALNALEIGCLTTPLNKDRNIIFDVAQAQQSIQQKQVVYDGDGDQHYDTISAFIKSMRGSDPDATVYWLAKMIYAGEDPRFIARRIMICASEDVGNADPQALVLATSAMQASEFVGMPEARIILSQAAVYVACAPKSNASYQAIDQALSDVRSKKIANVPAHLQDTHYKGSKKLGRGEGYQYPHDHPGHYVQQTYLPFEATYYVPSDQGYERKIRARQEDRKNS